MSQSPPPLAAALEELALFCGRLASNEALPALLPGTPPLAALLPAILPAILADAPGDLPPEIRSLAEALAELSGRIALRERERDDLIADLSTRNAELEAARRELLSRHQNLVKNLSNNYSLDKIVGNSPTMRKVVRQIERVAPWPISVLISGPTGAGKEVIAKTIHFTSPRSSAAFVAVNCTALPESLFESEMFGIEKGVATGVQSRIGRIEGASGGTLFLDEIGDMPLAQQAKLLRVLEERVVQRVGGSRPIPVDIKLIVASNVDLFEAVREGRFREDLYYRINVAEIHLPPLRERGEDVLLLAGRFLDKHCQDMGRERLVLSPQCRDYFTAYPWPGNVRELNNEMERLAALCYADVVQVEDLSHRIRNHMKQGRLDSGPDIPAELQSAPPGVFSETAPPSAGTAPDLAGAGLSLRELETLLIQQVIESCNGNKSLAAERLGLSREGLRKRLRRSDAETDPGQEAEE